ncbi:hypothetical protein GGS21DRAFT_545643 [Xylaria nigripes]|nr:hypothetical protein GGS21DRAFT_545643 [Xylaria nigripes]
MVGPSSKLPSTPALPGTYSDLGTPLSHASHQGFQEPVPSMISHPTAFVDPPRPAKEGYEWVWFPAGYWAEREIAETPPKDPTRTFRWHKRSGKSSSESAKNLTHTMQSPFTSSVLPEKTEKSPVMALHSRPPTNTSSESGVSPFTQNRILDAPPPSPYLSEEAHVQSLQWPALEATARKSSWSGGSMFKQRSALSPSPLHFSSPEAEGGSDSPGLSTVNGVKTKKSFMNWLMLSEHRQRPRKFSASADDGRAETDPVQPLLPQNPAASSARKESCKSDKTYKSRKGKFFSRSRWHRKISNSSAASTSSSVYNSIHSQSPCPSPTSLFEREEMSEEAWASEYPGNEARRVLVPHAMGASLDRFPRSFFSDLPASMAHHRPLLRQEGQQTLKKSHLSTSFKPANSSSSSTLHPRPTDSGSDRRTIRNNEREPDDWSTVITGGRKPERPTIGSIPKEWWEVPVPVPRPQEAARQRQKHPEMAVRLQRAFQFDLPEHLPTSPMCPANKRHKSGGTGVCVYHGRAKYREATPTTLSEDTSVGENSRDCDSGIGDGNAQEEGSEAGSDVWK